MSKQQYDADLFEGTKMTFGEHLTELRVCLVKAILGLVVGILVGFIFASSIVNFIQSPLKAALVDFYSKKSMAEIRKEYESLSEQQAEELATFVKRRQLAPKKYYMEAHEVERITKALRTESGGPPASANQTTTSSGSTSNDSGPKPDSGKESESLPGYKIVGDQPGPPSPIVFVVRLWQPIDTQLKSLNAHESFMIWFKAAFYAGIVFASPWIFYQIWQFVAAGLYPHERNYVYIYLPFSLILFVGGACLAFFVVFPFVLDFLFTFNRMMQIDPDPRISEWLSFALFLPLGFGVSFQLPLVMLFLYRIGVFSTESYLRKWRIAVLVIFVIAMILTPADPYSMLLMATPLTLLYFGGIGLCVWMPRGRRVYAEPAEP